MREATEQLSLAQKALGSVLEFVERVVTWVYDLDSDNSAAQAHLLGQVDLSHAASTQPAEQTAAADLMALQLRRLSQLRHLRSFARWLLAILLHNSALPAPRHMLHGTRLSHEGASGYATPARNS